MPAATGFPNVQVQVTFVAALDNSGNVSQSWWSFAPDEADLAYTGVQPTDTLSFKLNARKVDGSPLPAAAFAPTNGVRIQWPYAQPTRQGDPTVYSMAVSNQNTTSGSDGPYKFIASVQYNGQTYPSPDPSVVLEPRGG
jgi:hypothetical protein